MEVTPPHWPGNGKSDRGLLVKKDLFGTLTLNSVVSGAPGGRGIDYSHCKVGEIKEISSKMGLILLERTGGGGNLDFSEVKRH